MMMIKRVRILSNMLGRHVIITVNVIESQSQAKCFDNEPRSGSCDLIKF